MSRVRDVLATKGTHVLMVDPDTPVSRVAERMRALRVGALVVSADGEWVDGLVAERDLVFGLARYGANVLTLPVTAVMIRAFETCSLDDSIRTVMARMTQARVRHLPVLERGRLRGIISIGDVVKARVDDADLAASEMRDAYLVERPSLTTTS